MKILYIAHYKEGSGWSRAALDYISALDQNGFDVVCRNIQLTSREHDVPERILELESKSLQGVDVCIQHLLPHHMVGTKKFKKNIGVFVSETDTIKHTSWLPFLKNVDQIWVPNHNNQAHLINDGFDNVKVVPYAFDIDKYNQPRKKVNLYSANSKFKFYYIGDLNDRKNLIGTIRAFNGEFCNGEPVSLVIKIRKHGVQPRQLHDAFIKFSQQIKSQLRIHKKLEHYPSEIVITADASDDIIQDIHNTCDCYVGLSHGEGWSIPAFEAMCYGKTPICSNEGGPRDFIDSANVDTGTLVDGVYSVCAHSDPAFSDIFTGKENWFEPSEQLAKKAMRFYYENANKIDRAAGIKVAEKFSYQNIAKKIKDILDE